MTPEIVPVPPGTPATLYKYRQFDPDGYHMRLLDPGELWFSSARAFNDPFDSVLMFETEGTPPWKKRKWAEDFLQREMPHLGRLERRRLSRKWLREIARDPEHLDWLKEQHIESIYNTLGIYCLSEARDDLLMWAHYAASHTGFCVGLDTERLRRLRERVFVDSDTRQLVMHEVVSYQTEMPRPNFFESMTRDGPNEQTFSLLTTKSDHWAYEREHRLIYWHHPDTPLALLPESVSEVILGCRISDGDKRRVLGAVATNWPDARVLQARKGERRFALVFEEV